MTLPAFLKDRPFSEPTLVASDTHPALLAEIARLKQFGLDGRLSVIFGGDPSMVSIAINPESDPAEQAKSFAFWSQFIGL